MVQNLSFSLENKKIWVPGSSGMVSSSIIRKLKSENLNFIATNREEVDLLSQTDVNLFYKNYNPDVVILSAAKVGGIYANSNKPADFIYENLLIQSNVIHGAKLNNIKKLIFLGSSCIYPKECPQPIKEVYLLTSTLEKSNEAYAIAKIAGLKMCQAYRYQYGCDFISLMPTNLYGPNDNFDPKNSHVPAALISRFHKAKVNNDKNVVVWGTGKPLREFLHVDDLADASVFLLKNYSNSLPINVGTGSDISIQEFSKKISKVVGYKGQISFDTSMPDGTMKKRLDVSRINSLGWSHKINLDDGLHDYYAWYKKNVNEVE